MIAIRLVLCVFLWWIAMSERDAFSATIEVFATNIDAGGTDLRWKRFVPISGGPRWPAALVIHGGRFKSGDPGPASIAQDLANAGYLAFANEYRLAPPHTEMTNAGPPG